MSSRCTRAGEEMKDEKTVFVPLDHITKPLPRACDHRSVLELSGVHARIREAKEDKKVKRLVLKAPSSISKERFDDAKNMALNRIQTNDDEPPEKGVPTCDVEAHAALMQSKKTKGKASTVPSPTTNTSTSAMAVSDDASARTHVPFHAVSAAQPVDATYAVFAHAPGGVCKYLALPL